MVALVVGVLGFIGIAGTAINVAWTLFILGLILAVVLMIIGRRRSRVCVRSLEKKDQ
ncbi:MAG: DUF1328 family protein [Desulfobulbus sp.]|nr:DUF1328 family protein [Desulfobulbus sp.]